MKMLEQFVEWKKICCIRDSCALDGINENAVLTNFSLQGNNLETISAMANFHLKMNNIRTIILQADPHIFLQCTGYQRIRII